jgi:hypothetical protein
MRMFLNACNITASRLPSLLQFASQSLASSLSDDSQIPFRHLRSSKNH